MKIMIKTNGLSKYYGKGGKIKAVNDLTLEVYEKETFGLLGPNGAGKTTVARLLNGIIKPTSGTATVKEFDILEQENDVKRITGMLAESPGLYDKLSAYEFLEFMGALYDVPEGILKERINDLLKLFGLHDRRDHLIEGYSSGMKQKLLIAAALIHDPPILFLDEPTSTLDPRAFHMVKELIQELADTAGKTIFMCSHLLPVVEELCDRIGIINNGRLIAVGTINEIIARSGKGTLEEAFIALTGGLVNGELLAWREQVAQP
ncbi:MAG: ABC transporter ATP-binding protein [Candidatus Thorarchaeota archaeon]|jgi:ABC-2 type transport system ATP-binding protein